LVINLSLPAIVNRSNAIPSANPSCTALAVTPVPRISVDVQKLEQGLIKQASVVSPVIIMPRLSSTDSGDLSNGKQMYTVYLL